MTHLSPPTTDARAGRLPGPPPSVYDGFPLVEATRVNGWCFGALPPADGREDPEAGDGFVEAPDGSRAGLTWSVGFFPARRLSPPTNGRWGVYAVAFPKPLRCPADLVDGFRHILPQLRRMHTEATGGRRASL